MKIFKTTKIVGGTDGVHIVKSFEGRGTAYLQVENQDEIKSAKKSANSHKHQIKNERLQVINVFESTEEEQHTSK